MIRIFPVLISFLILHNWVIPIYGQDQPGTRIKEIAIEELPSEARTTLQLIEKGAPSPTNATARCSAISSAVYRSGSAVTIENLPYPHLGVVIAAPGALSSVRMVNSIIARTITGHSAKSAKVYQDDRQRTC
jgi:hypothetical protein